VLLHHGCGVESCSSAGVRHGKTFLDIAEYHSVSDTRAAVWIGQGFQDMGVRVNTHLVLLHYRWGLESYSGIGVWLGKTFLDIAKYHSASTMRTAVRITQGFQDMGIWVTAGLSVTPLHLWGGVILRCRHPTWQSIFGHCQIPLSILDVYGCPNRPRFPGYGCPSNCCT